MSLWLLPLLLVLQPNLHELERKIPAPSAVASCAASQTHMIGTASFVLVDSVGSHRLSFRSGAGLVFCRHTSDTMVWIRIAESDQNDGEDGRHLDIDACNLDGGGLFVPMEARARPCPGGRTWGVWWHESPDLVYANRADSAPCDLQLRVAGTTLVGSFTCNELVLDDGAASIALLEGRFECVLERPSVEEDQHAGFSEYGARRNVGPQPG